MRKSSSPVLSVLVVVAIISISFSSADKEGWTEKKRPAHRADMKTNNTKKILFFISHLFTALVFILGTGIEAPGVFKQGIMARVQHDTKKIPLSI
jgi:hypothetical protein